MSEALGDAVLYLRTDDAGLKKGMASAKDDADKLDSHFKATGDRIANIGERLTKTVTLGGVAFAGFALKAASDAAELQSAFGQTFGKMSGDMNEWARKTGDAMGRSTQEMQKMANTFGLLFTKAAPTQKAAADLSRQFSVLAQDLASFYNVDPGDALDKLRSGLTGEAEPLRDFGVFLNEAAVAEKALEMGLAKTSKELTEQDKIMARAAVIMQQTAIAQGDVARTSDGAANKVRAAKAAMEELQVTVGSKLLPAVVPLIGAVTNLLNGFSTLPAPVQSALLAFAGFGIVLGPLLQGIGGIVAVGGPAVTRLLSIGAASSTAGAGIAGIAGKMGLAKTAFAGLLAVLGPLAVPLAAVAAAGAVIYTNWGKIGPVLGDLGKRFTEVLGPQLQEMIATISSVLSTLWQGPLGSLVRGVIGILGELLSILLKVFGEVVIRAVGVVASAINGAMHVISGALKLVTGILTLDWRKAWEGAKEIVTGIVRGILNVIESLAPGATAVFKALVDGAKRFLLDGLSFVFRKIQDMIQALGDKFKWLLDVVITHSWIPDLVKGIELWFSKLPEVMVKPAVDAANAVSAAFAGIVPPDTIGGMIERTDDNDPFAAGRDAPPVPEFAYEQEWSAGFRDWFAGGIRAAIDGDLGSYLKSWLSSLGDRLLDQFIGSFATAITGQLGGLFGSGGGIGGLLDGLFAGGFATGGLIPHGKWGIVGERGPEPVFATPRGVMVRPNSALSSSVGRPAAPRVNLSISIDATGADPAQLARTNAKLDQLKSDLPGMIVGTMEDAGTRGILDTARWR